MAWVGLDHGSGLVWVASLFWDSSVCSAYGQAAANTSRVSSSGRVKEFHFLKWDIPWEWANGNGNEAAQHDTWGRQTGRVYKWPECFGGKRQTGFVMFPKTAFFGWKGLFSMTVRTQGLALCLVRTKAEQLKFTGLSYINSPFQGHCKESDLLCARHCSNHFHLLAL